MTEREKRRAARQERRRQRRERRAQRRAAGLPDEAEPDPEAEEETEQTLEAGMKASSDKANKLGEMLKKTLTSASAAELPAGEGKSLGAVIAAAAAPRLKEPPNVTRPTTTSDFLAAARSGYAGSFEAIGLNVGHNEVLDKSGRPATPAQLEALAAHIASEPEALTRRPDFFKVLPREKFQDLKSDIKRPDMGEEIFKHVVLTEGERDFVWSQSCGGVSGGCNRYVSQTSYRRGDGLPPEDLGSLWTAVHDGAPQARPAPAAVDPRGIRSRLNVVLSHIRSVFQGDNPAAANSAPGVFAGRTLGSLAFAGAGQRPEVTYSSAPERRKVDVASPVMPVAQDKRPAAVIALVLAAAGLAAAVLRSRP